MTIAGIDDAIRSAIDAAEEIRDPTEGLVEKTVADPGAAFAPEMLKRLAQAGRSRGLRVAAGAIEEGWMPGDGA